MFTLAVEMSESVDPSQGCSTPMMSVAVSDVCLTNAYVSDCLCVTGSGRVCGGEYPWWVPAQPIATQR